MKTSEQHESQVDQLWDMFYDTPRKKEDKWMPHLSLAYDNPENSPLDIGSALDVVKEFPSLLSYGERKPTSMVLWNTNGTLDEWREVCAVALD